MAPRARIETTFLRPLSFPLAGRQPGCEELSHGTRSGEGGAARGQGRDLGDGVLPWARGYLLRGPFHVEEDKQTCSWRTQWLLCLPVGSSHNLPINVLLHSFYRQGIRLFHCCTPSKGQTAIQTQAFHSSWSPHNGLSPDSQAGPSVDQGEPTAPFQEEMY